MSKRCEMCGGSGVVFTTSLLGQGDKDTCPECGGQGIVKPATAPTGKRDATADLAMCDAATPGPWFVDIVNTTDSESGICYGTPGDTSDTYDLIDAYNVETDYKLMCEAREALPYWLREAEQLRGVAEANLAMSADLIAMEGTIKELQFALVNHAQFQRGIECQFCRLSFELGTSDDVLTQHAMTCEKSPVVQENARLRAELYEKQQ